MPQTRLVSLLQVFFGLTSLIFVAVIGLVLWITIYRPGPDAVPLLPALGSILVLAACAVVPWYIISLPRRARRALTKYPDLIGHFHGSLSPQGLCFVDRDGTAWIAPTAIARSNISRFGIRIPIGPDPYRFLPLPLKIFDGGDAENLREIKRSSIQIAESLVSGEDYRRHASVAFGPVQAETVYGSGQLTVTTPLSRSEKTIAYVSLAFYALVMIYAGSLAFEYQTVWAAVLAIAAAVCIGTEARQIIKQLSGGRQAQAFQWTAIDPDKWVIGDAWLAQTFPVHDFLSIQWHDEVVTATLNGERTVCIFKSLLEGDQDVAWHRLQQIVPARAS